jgi:hypothetical protein
MSKSPYTSVTETVARILSLLITLLCFSIYILSKSVNLSLDWSLLLVHLGVFWAVYEVFSFCFFLLLQQFAATKDHDTKPLPAQEQLAKAVEPNDTFIK